MKKIKLKIKTITRTRVLVGILSVLGLIGLASFGFFAAFNRKNTLARYRILYNRSTSPVFPTTRPAAPGYRPGAPIYVKPYTIIPSYRTLPTLPPKPPAYR